MTQLSRAEGKKGGRASEAVSWLGRVLLAAGIPLIAFAVIYAGFIFLRDADAPRWLTVIVAIVWGYLFAFFGAKGITDRGDGRAWSASLA